MFTPDGIMPEGGPETVLTVLSAFKKELQGKQIDLPRPTPGIRQERQVIMPAR